jgi:hypothetical protein
MIRTVTRAKTWVLRKEGVERTKRGFLALVLLRALPQSRVGQALQQVIQVALRVSPVHWFQGLLGLELE